MHLILGMHIVLGQDTFFPKSLEKKKKTYINRGKYRVKIPKESA